MRYESSLYRRFPQGFIQLCSLIREAPSQVGKSLTQVLYALYNLFLGQRLYNAFLTSVNFSSYFEGTIKVHAFALHLINLFQPGW